MNRAIISKILSTPVIAIGALVSLAGMAAAQDAPPPPPPPAYVATAQPVYYEGHASYWYNNHWYYRDARGGWNHYDNEPQALHDRRNSAPPQRHYYENHGNANAGHANANAAHGNEHRR